MNELRLEIVFANPLLLAQAPPAPAAIRARLTVRMDQFTFTGENLMYTLPVDHTVQMQVSYVDAAGNPATVDSEVTWTSSDDSIAAIEVDSGDSTMVRIVPATVGQVQISASCDADIGTGVRELITIADISVVGGEAVAGSIQPVGEPEPVTPQAAKRK
jgi:hypothetical protein